MAREMHVCAAQAANALNAADCELLDLAERARAAVRCYPGVERSGKTQPALLAGR